ncbi:beta-1,3-glucan-binding protein-like isoform X2 [Sitodiplosis mosellana]|uniref:beta-1,3-glucan-binding protein-like isoform X2 n=1 Tax=Sitodiplosis mosellana TaxID=263140 RepID=UPI0024442F6C|nr:beta-1,3-glucan-binding protein-like isoform X2 [Sitodiplosis mosellana]
MLPILYLLLCIVAVSFADDCLPSITTASGSSAPQKICSGQLIFEENFDSLNKEIWKPLSTFSDGGNKEFQWYVADDENSFAMDGKLHIKPTLAADKIGSDAVESGYIHLDDCTDSNNANCERQAGGNIIINPVRSARLTTGSSFSFKYGRLEVIAKLPLGELLWPAVWLLPTGWRYGGWPRSGEVDLFEARGNIKYGNDVQIGVEQIGMRIHYGPNWDKKASQGYEKNNAAGFHSGFHKYEYLWDETGVRFLLDGSQIGHVPVADGFWKRGGFDGENIWASATKMAPFDQEFHLIINLAVGGTFFPDVNYQNGPRPWTNNWATAMKEFWTNRNQWLPSWENREKSSLQVDSVKVWAI